MAMRTIQVEFDDDGNANITLPGGEKEYRTIKNQADLAKLTEELAKSMGNITERHKPHSHIFLDSKGKMQQQEHTHE